MRASDLRDVAAEWDVQVDGPLVDGPRSSLAVTTATGEAALLEHAPAGSPYEHLALRAWEGRGAVRLLRADPHRHLLLTERTRPGDDLNRLGPWEGCTQLGALYATLHRDPIPQPPRLASLAADWLADLDAPRAAGVVPRRFLDQVRAWTPGLVDERSAPQVLLHGDLRMETVRAADREPWLAVAPRPVVGDPAYEVGAVFGRPWADAGSDARAEIVERFYAIVDAAGLDEDRARAWVVVRTVAAVVARTARGDVSASAVTWATTVVKAVQR